MRMSLPGTGIPLPGVTLHRGGPRQFQRLGLILSGPYFIRDAQQLTGPAFVKDAYRLLKGSGNKAIVWPPLHMKD